MTKEEKLQSARQQSEKGLVRKEIEKSVKDIFELDLLEEA